MLSERLLFKDPETGGKITKRGAQIIMHYPESNFKDCPIYQRQKHCCGKLCTTNCPYYSFHLKQKTWWEKRRKKNEQRG